MTADFNAGSIEGSVRLDITPFRQGLEQAKRQAAEFEKAKIQPKVTLDTSDFDASKLRVEAAIADLGNDTANVNVSIDISGAMAKLALLKATMDSITNHPVSAMTSGIYNGAGGGFSAHRPSSITRAAESVVSGVVGNGVGRPSLMSRLGSGVLGGLDRLSLMSANPFNSSSGLGRVLDVGGATHLGLGVARAVPVMPAAMAVGGMGVLSLLPALASATAAVGTFGAAAALGAVTLGAGLKGYASLVKNDIKDLKKNPDAYGSQGRAFLADEKRLGRAQDRLQKATMPGVLGVAGGAVSLAASVLPRLVPVVNAISHGLDVVITDIRHLTDSPLMGKFLGGLTTFFGKTLSGAGPVVEKVLGSVMRLFIDLQPVMGMIGHEIGSLVTKGAAWVKTLNPAEVSKFASNAVTAFKPLLGVIGSTVSTIYSISKALQPIEKPFQDFIANLGKGVQALAFHDVAAGLGSVLKALGPIIPVLAQMVNAVAKPLGVFLTDLSNVALGPLVKSLGKELAPALHEIQTGLTQVAPYLAQFVGSFANLINPTGVHLFTTLVHDLMGAFVKLGPPLLQIGVLLESVIDSGLMSAMPIIDGVARAVGGMAVALHAVLGPIVSLVTSSPALTKVLGIMLDTWIALKIATAGAGIAATITAFQETGLAVAMAAQAVAAGDAADAMAALDLAMDANPIGAVLGIVGLLVGGLVALSMGFKHAGNAAIVNYAAIAHAKGMKDAKAAADGLYQSLNKVSGAYTAASRAAIRMDLEKPGTDMNKLLQAAQAQGMSEGEVIDAITHRSKKAEADLAAVEKGLVSGNTERAKKIKQLEALAAQIQTTGDKTVGNAAVNKATGLGVSGLKTFSWNDNFGADKNANVRAILTEIAKLKGLSAQADETAGSVRRAVTAMNAKLTKGWVNQVVDATSAMGKLKGVSKATFDQFKPPLKVALDQDVYHKTTSGIVDLATKWRSFAPGMSGNTALALAKVLVAQDPSIAATYRNVKTLQGVLLGVTKPAVAKVSITNAAPTINSARTLWDYLTGINGYHASASVTTYHRDVNASKGSPHARGGVTTGPMFYGDIVGDNVGRHEAIIPLEKYDLPKKGESDRSTARREAADADRHAALIREVMALRQIMAEMLDKIGSPEELAAVLGKMSDAQLRRLLQIARSN